MELEWCKKHDKGLPKPDFVFYLDISVEEAMKREGFGLELFEKKDFQNRVRDSYKQLFGDEWIIIPANKSAEEVHKEIVLNLDKNSVTGLSISQTIQKLWVDA